MLGIKVLLQDSQKALEQLKAMGILRSRFQVVRVEQHLFIPVKNVPETLKVSFEKVEYPFPSRKQDHLSLKDYLEKIVPRGIKIPTSFDVIGDIAIIDIKDEMLPYKYEVAEGILKTSPKISSVYRKTTAVSGPYRVRKLELLVGEKKGTTIHQEHGVKMVVDVLNVYFSPRLSTEHRRVADVVCNGENILDMFTAVGAFPLVIAKYRQVKVTAVDINPIGLECLKRSITLNKLKGEIFPICADASKLNVDLQFDRVIMNHPSAARHFLVSADKYLKRGGFLHYYSFIDSEKLEENAKEELLAILPDYKIIEVRKVRQYSPQSFHVVVDARKN